MPRGPRPKRKADPQASEVWPSGIEIVAVAGCKQIRYMSRYVNVGKSEAHFFRLEDLTFFWNDIFLFKMKTIVKARTPSAFQARFWSVGRTWLLWRRANSKACCPMEMEEKGYWKHMETYGNQCWKQLFLTLFYIWNNRKHQNRASQRAKIQGLPGDPRAHRANHRLGDPVVVLILQKKHSYGELAPVRGWFQIYPHLK